MLPALAHGKVVVAWRLKRPRIGDVVIARHDGKELIKRVSDIRKGAIYLLGDNPALSTDSRHFGWLPIGTIKGVVIGGRS